MDGDSDGGGGGEGGDEDAGGGQGRRGGAYLVLCRPTKAAVLPLPHLSTGVKASPTASHQGRHLLREHGQTEMCGGSPVNGTVEVANVAMPPLCKLIFSSLALLVVMGLNSVQVVLTVDKQIK